MPRIQMVHLKSIRQCDYTVRTIAQIRDEAAVQLLHIDDRAKVVDIDVPPNSSYSDTVLSLLTAPVHG